MTPATILAMGLVKQFEGCKLTAYRDIGNTLTIGYGHTGPDVTEGQVIAQQEADELLSEDVARAETAVRRLCPASLSDKQIAACIDLAYNVGIGAFSNSHVLYCARNSLYIEAAKAFTMWDMSGHVESMGLLRRRFVEAATFLEGS